MLGVVKEVPVPNIDPPVDAAYQFTVPALGLAPKTTVPASQREPGVVEVMVGNGVMVTITEREVSPNTPELTTRRYHVF